ncbi:hypothetical protein HWV62_26156 [Athelia sp. TMB]|nr:hypothetical protein HWV62_26156 [Athelia sp. TMB]
MRPPTPTGDGWAMSLQSGDLVILYEDLQHWNNTGVMVTFDLIQKRWAQWLRPINWSTRPPTPVAARHFRERAANNLPLCPHICFGGLTFEDCQMQPYRERYQGHYRYVFSARGHQCEFKSIFFLFSLLTLLNLPPPVVIPPVDPSLPFEQFIQEQFRTKYPLRRGNGAAPSGQQQLDGNLPSAGPSQSPSVQHVNKVDTYLNETSFSRRGHPASIRGLPPPALEQYHECATEFQDLRFDHTMVANGMLHHHPTNCGNEPPSALRQYHPDFISGESPLPLDLFRTTAVGRALLEWNSSVGISMDAWKTITTAYVHCDGCNRFRSFDGDCLHRDVQGFPSCGGRALGFFEAAEKPVNFENSKRDVKGKAREYIVIDSD